jgi:hypothetical protein
MQSPFIRDVGSLENSSQLPGGKYYIPENDIKTQCVPVPKTNIISEADFSALDRLSGPQISFPMIPNALHSASNVSFFIIF